VLGRQGVRLIRFSVFRSLCSGNSGFTLLELLVVIVITGILAAIALPAFLSRANSAKQVEAKVAIGALNRAQQAYYMERSEFVIDSAQISKLGIKVQLNSDNYEYLITSGGQGNRAVLHHARSNSRTLRPYVGMAALVFNGTQGVTVQTVLCEAERPAFGKTVDPDYSPNVSISCASGSQSLN
jgi:type IV pilus assembly protein PilA